MTGFSAAQARSRLYSSHDRPEPDSTVIAASKCVIGLSSCMYLQGHYRILLNGRSLDIGYFERKYTF